MEIEIRNIGIIKTAHLEFVPGLNLIVGSSSSGKSTLLRAIRSMMDNTFTDSSVTYGQTKMAIKVVYNGHSVTYVRDVDKSSRKSAYQIDGKVYTKIGRGSLDELSDIFRLSPIDIDGEKINFNFSSQFSGPFLLLGSTSLLYSILTYRSSFDITKINDLYFSDLKKVKQDINVLLKTKENLDREKFKIDKELNTLSDIPSLYTRIQEFKERYFNLEQQKSTYSKYKESLTYLSRLQDKVSVLQKIKDKFVVYNKLYSIFSILQSYFILKDTVSSMKKRMELLIHILERVSSFQPKLDFVICLKKYIDCVNKHKNLSMILKESIPTTNLISNLYLYIQAREQINETNFSINGIVEELQSVSKEIEIIGVCPLCNQPLKHEH